MKILVTGAAGFIGSNLSEYLLGKGYRVVGIDCFTPYYGRKIKEFNISGFRNNPDFVFYEVDFSEEKELDKVFEENSDISATVHLGAWGGVTYSIENPLVYAMDNIYGTSLVAKKSAEVGAKSFIFSSSSSIYGDTKAPFKEDTSTDRIFSPYGASKKACEVILYPFSRNYNLNVTIFRFFNPIGPRLRPDLALPKLIKSAEYGFEFPLYQDLRKNSRDYTYLGHMLNAIHHVIKNPLRYEIMNLGNSNPVSLGELRDIVEKVTGKKVRFARKSPRKGEMKTTYANISKAKRLIKYNPTTSIEDCVKMYYDWFVKQPAWYKKIKL